MEELRRLEDFFIVATLLSWVFLLSSLLVGPLFQTKKASNVFYLFFVSFLLGCSVFM